MSEINSKFNIFYQNILLTDNQKNDAKTKYDGVCKKLHDTYYSGLTYNGSTKFLIGSYAKSTNIRPPRDIDVIFKMPHEEFEKYNNCSGNGQSKLLQDIKSILNTKYTTTETIKGWGKVVLIKFSDNTHNVELLPAWEQSSGVFKIPNTENGGTWELFDPRNDISRIQDSSNSTSGETIKIIRMIKKWIEFCNVDIKSFEIENYIVDFFNLYKVKDKYSEMFLEVFNYLYHKTTDSNTQSKINSAYNRAKKAIDYENEEKLAESVNEWQKIFGNDFPSLKINAYEIISDIPLGDTSHCLPIQWMELNSNKVNIDAFIYTNRNGKKLGGLNSNGRKLSKSLSLYFKAETYVLEEYDVWWQVVNTGNDARSYGIEALRGQWFKGNQWRWEDTQYFGKHWIECAVISKSGFCLARSGRFYVNIT